jgi:hypothetical protein
MASIIFNQDFRPGLIKTSDPDQSRLQTDKLWFQSFLIKTSDPDKSKLLTRINNDFKPIQLWLQSLSIKTSDPDQSRLETDSIMASIP